MMKILLISASRTAPPDGGSQNEFLDFVQDALQGSTATAQNTYADNLIFRIKNNEFEIYDTLRGQIISDVDMIFYRGPWLYENGPCGYYVSRFCRWNNIRCVNDFSAYYPGTKLAQNIAFIEHQAPILETLYSLNTTKLLEHSEDRFGYPYILKTNLGSHGDSNYLVKSRQEADDIIANEPTVDFIAQEYCPNDRDYRLLLIGSEQLVFERRGGSDTHLNNTSKGGEATLVTDVIPADLVDRAHAVMKTLGLTIAGVDVMPNLDTGELRFLEINSQPQIRTGALLDEKKQQLRAFFDSLETSDSAD